MAEQKGQHAAAGAGTTIQEPEQAQEIDLIEIGYKLLEHWKLLLCMALIFAVAAGMYTVRMVTPLYKATATIYVVNRSDSVINMSDLQLGSALTSDYIKVFEMWELHDQVIRNLNLPYSYSTMKSRLSVTNDSGTRMLDITFTSPDPVEAAEVANEYASVGSSYIAETMVTDRPSLMSVALVPTAPVNISIRRNTLMGFLAGLALGAAIVALRTILDDKYKNSEDVRRYAGLSVLATIPVDKAFDSTRGKKKSAGRKHE